MAACHRALRQRDATAPGAVRDLEALTVAILALLVVDLFTCRGVPAARSVIASALFQALPSAFGNNLRRA
jgi:hypothetical protein